MKFIGYRNGLFRNPVYSKRVPLVNVCVPFGFTEYPVWEIYVTRCD